MKKLLYAAVLSIAIGSTACSDEHDLVIPYPTNITFEDLNIPERFSHVIPSGGFEVEGICFNTVKDASGRQLAGGFCYSNRSMRSFTWTGTEEAIDSLRYSVWTKKPNDTGNYLVVHAADDQAYFTFNTPRVIEYLLVANSTWGYLAAYYGDSYGTPESPKANPNVPSGVKGAWQTYVPGGVNKLGATGDYVSVIAIGYNNGKEVGKATFDLLCTPGHNPDFPDYNYFVTEWRRFDLASFGAVDKVLFRFDSSDKDENGNVRTPAWFCIDGIQLQ